ncbi:hypothetical protein [Bordetella sp. BOR01]|uniref:hypothetical protein n=1 Tax=Bordetella sp. BOR01 TaxID=2854779 RepID=UPI001C4625FD|nr:hypothetical protein [Bordetella sp. BOR01]MBV7483829.1 hypothetical protein [Bordetella sp. BOR01]
MTLLTPTRLRRAAQSLVVDQFAVAHGEDVLITADSHTDTLLVDTVAQSVAQAGGRPLVAVAPRLPYQGGLSDPYVTAPLRAAASAADVWFDFCFPYHAGSGAHADAMAAGRCRYALLAMSSAASFERLYGGVDFPALMDFNIAFMDFIASAAGEEVRVTCPAGTDIRFRLDEVKLKRPRVRNRPGMDTVPGTQSLYPLLDTISGRIVIQALFDEEYRRLRLPITINAQGRIRDFTGGGIEDRISFDRALRRASGTDGFGSFIHFTFGFHPGTQLTGTQFIEDIRLPGSNAIGMGLPWWEPGGGENHPDGIVFDQSLWVGDTKVSDSGRFVGPPELLELHAAMRRRLD